MLTKKPDNFEINQFQKLTDRKFPTLPVYYLRKNKSIKSVSNDNT